MSKLLIVEGPGTGKEYPLDRTPLVIGRRADAQICLATKDVSRSHAQLTCERNRFYIEDMGSSNGTWLNGMPVDGKVEVYDQDQIGVGSYVLQVNLTEAASAPEVTIRAELRARDTDRYFYEHDATTKLRYVLQIAQVLGRTLELDELLPQLLDHLLKLFPQADRGLVLMQMDDNLVDRASRSRPRFGDSERGYSRSVVQKVLTEGVGVVATTEEQGDPNASIMALGIRSFMSVPLQATEGQPIGVLQLDCFTPGKEFSKEDLQMLTAVSMQAASVLNNASLHMELLQQERVKRDLDLARLSQMVAGVAHEINNPLAFVSNNTTVLKRDLEALCQLLQLYGKSKECLANHQPELQKEISDSIEEIDLPYTLENLERILTRSHDGLKRIQKIVEDLRNFARLDQSEFDKVDLNVGISSTLGTMKGLFDQNQIKLEQQLGELPKVECSPSRINQVIFNLVHNALDACSPGDTITVRTCAADDQVEIHITDTGPGIPPDVREKVFDPFFTTKPLGKGVGLGLSLVYGIIQDHKGSIEVESEPGDGAHFVVRLPCGSIAS